MKYKILVFVLFTSLTLVLLIFMKKWKDATVILMKIILTLPEWWLRLGAVGVAKLDMFMFLSSYKSSRVLFQSLNQLHSHHNVTAIWKTKNTTNPSSRGLLVILKLYSLAYQIIRK